ncbi:MAG TPA: hypothetical protein VFS25_16320 [Chitinophaga sp.]|uniref:SF0329 family protein n=1 Tax=Chitinophaga sp. TaxID=1869181 RepID=UPI002DB71317|nr:hypothetical protein [Chitinophaga sp.]HEU4554414.1 hypothetical protein [Chitinophaga sp.]
MQWSKLKHTIESRFADSISGRVELFTTAYRKPRSTDGRGWITIDKEQIVDFCTIKSWWKFGAYYHKATRTNCLTHRATEDNERSAGKLAEEGEFSRYDLHVCCWEYLNMTVEEGLEHKSPIINSLAVLDKRLGKRRLAALDKDKLHPLAKRLLEFRLSAEGLE